MKKFRLLVIVCLLLCCPLFFIACGAPELSSPKKLSINDSTLVLTWDKVDNAIGYVVKVGDMEKKVRENSYSLAGVAAGEYNVRVKSLGDGDSYQDSAWSSAIKFTREYESGVVYTLINNNTEYEVTRVGTASGDVEIADVYRGKPVTKIAASAFNGSNRITSLKIGKNVKSIGERAFYNCTVMTSVEIPDNVVEIGNYAFQSCGNLTEITLPESITEVSDFMFAYCRKLTTVNLSNKVTRIGESAFSNCNLLTSITLPDSVKIIDNNAFLKSGLTNIEFGNGVVSLGEYSFSQCNGLKEITVSNNINLIGNFAFAGSNALERVIIGDSVLAIGQSAFMNCVKLESASIGNGVVSVGRYAFSNTKIWANAEELVYVDNWLIGCKNSEVRRIEFQENTVGIAQYAFAGYSLLEEVDIPENTKIIDARVIFRL